MKGGIMVLKDGVMNHGGLCQKLVSESENTPFSMTDIRI